MNEKIKYMAIGGALVGGLFLFAKTRKYILYGTIGYFIYKKMKSGEPVGVESIAEFPKMASAATSKVMQTLLPQPGTDRYYDSRTAS